MGPSQNGVRALTASLHLEILLPRTDAGVLAQLVALAAVVLAVSVLLRHQRELLLLTWGIGLMVLGGMGLRAIH
ncbi:MAG: hypothetical protein U5K29_13925 [Acidimicrobiales bacterium]|nr:hypothetical protein [Acidimicrobiales bacterium]